MSTEDEMMGLLRDSDIETEEGDGYLRAQLSDNVEVHFESSKVTLTVSHDHGMLTSCISYDDIEMSGGAFRFNTENGWMSFNGV